MITKIKYCDDILEYLGCAKTAENDNSSRFMRMIKVRMCMYDSTLVAFALS